MWSATGEKQNIFVKVRHKETGRLGRFEKWLYPSQLKGQITPELNESFSDYALVRWDDDWSITQVHQSEIEVVPK